MYIFTILALAATQIAAICTSDDCLHVIQERDNNDNKYAPCAQVAYAWAVQHVASPTTQPTVSAAVGYQCLNSVSFHATEALALVQQIKPFLDFQSDTAYKKDPPGDYFFPPFDMGKKLDEIIAKVQSNAYVNEIAFQEDLYQITALAHDGHFSFYPDLLTRVMHFGRPHALVSVSRDGIELPQIYVFEDLNSSYADASVLTQINGQDAATFVSDWINQATANQDPDAAYNTMFWSKPLVAVNLARENKTTSGYFHNEGRARFIYPGPNTTYSFANGTTYVLDNIAYLNGNFSGLPIFDGESLFSAFCTYAFPNDPPPQTIGSTVVPGYPQPVIISNGSNVSGYYLDGEGFEDVAVLSLLMFMGESSVEYQKVVEDFLADAVANYKTKLIIDLSGNPGGLILQGYDTFRQLFPSIVQKDYTRARINNISTIASTLFSSHIPPHYRPELDPEAFIVEDYVGLWDWHFDLNAKGKPFHDFYAKFRPVFNKGDSFTQIIRWDPSNPYVSTNTTFGLGIEITGYGSRKNFTHKFFPENIILLTDGNCGGTCTIFSEFLRLQAGVRSVVTGGRPKNGPMQALGGIKGAHDISFAALYNKMQSASSQGADAFQATVLNITQLPQNRSSRATVNLRDNILPPYLDTGLPAQYVFEEADCRLFYTKEMVFDISAVWKAAASAAWKGAKCVAGPGFKDDVKIKSIVPRDDVDLDHDAEMNMRRDIVKRVIGAFQFDPSARSYMTAQAYN